MEKFEKIYDYEDRLVRFAGETALFAEKLPNTYTANYYKNQLIRSSGSTVLNYGEVQGTVTDKDFIHKMSVVVKELKESRACLKVLTYLKLGENIIDLLPFNKQPSENIFFRYFPLKNKSVARLCTDFLKKTIEKIYNSSSHFLKGNKSNEK